MSVIGIDVGSECCVIAVAGRGSIEIVVNEMSQRRIPSIVAFSPNERLVGDGAMTQIRSNFANTCRGMKYLVGKQYSEKAILNDTQHSLCRLTADEIGHVAYEVTHKGVTMAMNATRVMAILLSKLKYTAEKALSCPVGEVTLSCPSWYTDANCAALMASAEIAGIYAKSVMREHVATAMNYGIFRIKQFDEKKPTRVIFFSMGYRSTFLCAAEFLKHDFTIVANVCDPYLGGYDLDKVIIHHIAQSFEKCHGISTRDRPKCRLILEENAATMKKILSANLDTSFQIECLVDDYDCSGVITRKQFEEGCSVELLPRLQAMMEAIMIESGWSKDMVDFVEIVGGSSRTPWIQQAVSTFFSKELSRTLQADECVARGCALQGAMCSPLFRVKEYVANKIVPYGISGRFVDGDATASSLACNGDQTSEEYVFFTPKDKVCTRVQSVNRNKSFCIDVNYSNNEAIPPGILPKIGNFFVDLPAGESFNAIKFTSVMDICEMFAIKDCYGVQSKQVEEIHKEKKPIQPTTAAQQKDESQESNKDSSGAEREASSETTNPTAETPKQQYEEVSVRRTVTRDVKVPLKVVVQRPPSYFTSAQIQQYFESEINMANDDRLYVECQSKMNELESYIYDIRMQFESRLQQFMEPQKREEFLRLTCEYEEWLYDYHEHTKVETVKRLDNLKSFGDVLINRENHFELLAHSFRELDDTIASCLSMANNQSEAFYHISAESRRKIFDLSENISGWKAKMIAQQETLEKWVDPIVSSEMVSAKAEELRQLTRKIMEEPKPAEPAAVPGEAADPNLEEANCKMKSVLIEDNPPTELDVGQG